MVSRKYWVNQCAQRLHKLCGLEWNKSLSEAKHLADMQAEENGTSGIAWKSPGDAADEYQEILESFKD